jgi:hypothetical protein
LQDKTLSTIRDDEFEAPAFFYSLFPLGCVKSEFQVETLNKNNSEEIKAQTSRFRIFRKNLEVSPQSLRL